MRHSIIAIGLTAIAATSFGQPTVNDALVSQGNAILRVYDVRSIMMPEGVSRAGGATTLPSQAIAAMTTTSESSTPSPFLATMPAETALAFAGGGSEMVVSQLCEIIGMSARVLGPGVVAAQGVIDEHEQLELALQSLRALSGEPVLVELRWYTVPSSTVPDLGSTIDAPGASTSARVALHPGRSATIANTTSERYTTGWTPIVSQGSVGYEPQFETAEEGFFATINVGQPQPDGRIPLHVNGEFADVEITKVEVESTGDGPKSLSYMLPQISRQRFDTSMGIVPGALFVIATMPSATEGESVVMAASVRKYEAAK